MMFIQTQLIAYCNKINDATREDEKGNVVEYMSLSQMLLLLLQFTVYCNVDYSDITTHLKPVITGDDNIVDVSAATLMDHCEAVSSSSSVIMW